MPNIIIPFRKVPNNVLPLNSLVANTVQRTISILAATESVLAAKNSELQLISRNLHVQGGQLATVGYDFPNGGGGISSNIPTFVSRT
jgi:hypothetical protein